jgi:hypothetical protein
MANTPIYLPPTYLLPTFLPYYINRVKNTIYEINMWNEWVDKSNYLIIIKVWPIN